jgi:hypothetical protein
MSGVTVYLVTRQSIMPGDPGDDLSYRLARSPQAMRAAMREMLAEYWAWMRDENDTPEDYDDDEARCERLIDSLPEHHDIDLLDDGMELLRWQTIQLPDEPGETRDGG